MVLSVTMLLDEKLAIFTLIDRKMIFQDGSRLRILPSETEPKARFYVEAGDPDKTDLLV